MLFHTVPFTARRSDSAHMRRGRQSEEETKPTKCVSTRKARNIGGRWRVQALQESNAVGVSQQAWIVRDCQSNSHLRSFSCSHLLVKSTAAFLDLFGVDFEGLRQHGVPTSGLPPWPPVHAHRLGALCDWRRAMDSCVSLLSQLCVIGASLAPRTFLSSFCPTAELIL